MRRYAIGARSGSGSGLKPSARGGMAVAPALLCWPEAAVEFVCVCVCVVGFTRSQRIASSTRSGTTFSCVCVCVCVHGPTDAASFSRFASSPRARETRTCHLHRDDAAPVGARFGGCGHRTRPKKGEPPKKAASEGCHVVSMDGFERRCLQLHLLLSLHPRLAWG